MNEGLIMNNLSEIEMHQLNLFSPNREDPSNVSMFTITGARHTPADGKEWN